MVTVALAFAVIGIGGSASDDRASCSPRARPRCVASLLLGGVVADRVSRRAIMVWRGPVPAASRRACSPALVIAGSADVWTIALLVGPDRDRDRVLQPRLDRAAAADRAAGAPPAGQRRARDRDVRGRDRRPGAGRRARGGRRRGLGARGRRGDVRRQRAAADRRARAAARRARGRVASGPTCARAGRRSAGTTWVWTFVLWASLANVTWGAWSVLGPVIAEHELGGAAAWGAINAALGVGALIGALAAIRQMPRRPILAAALTGFTVSAPRWRCSPPGAHAVPIAIGALRVRDRDDVRQRGLGVRAAAPHPARGALARERLRLVRLVRLRAGRPGDLGPDRGRRRHRARRSGSRPPSRSSRPWRCWPCATCAGSRPPSARPARRGSSPRRGRSAP